MMSASGIDTNGHPLSSLRSMDTRRYRLKAFTNEVKLYERYFHKRIAKEVSYAQLGFAVIILILQLIIMGILFGPSTVGDNNIGIKTSGIFPSIITSFAAGVTLWATKKPTYCKLHTAMALHIVVAVSHLYLEYFIMETTIPFLQWRISSLYSDPSGMDANKNSQFYIITTVKNQYQEYESEIGRTVACLVFSVVISLSGIFQVMMALFMALKTGRAICSGRTQLEGRKLQLETVETGHVGPDMRRIREDDHHEKELEEEDEVFPKLERSDTLPPPPYESGYFNHSLMA